MGHGKIDAVHPKTLNAIHRATLLGLKPAAIVLPTIGTSRSSIDSLKHSKSSQPTTRSSSSPLTKRPRT